MKCLLKRATFSFLCPIICLVCIAGGGSPVGGPAHDSADSVISIFRLKVFEEPLVPVGNVPSDEENEDLRGDLTKYSNRANPDDFSSLVAFLDRHPRSSWNASLLTSMGIDYYNTAHYSLAVDAWSRGWELAKTATDAKGRAIADRAAGELAYMYSRLGRMTDLEQLLDSVGDRVFTGSSTERITGAREALWNMKHRPEVSFRCGPLALRQIQLTTDPQHPIDDLIYSSASTPTGFSLTQVVELAKKAGLGYRMAYREPGADLIVPAVVHWKLGHYAALVRRENGRYLLQDPTFGTSVWATRSALDAETSGYFVVPDRTLPQGWRAVAASEGDAIHGKGVTGSSDPKRYGPPEPRSNPKGCSDDGTGMAVPSVHFMLVNLHLDDEPIGYSPPVGLPVRFALRYNHRDAFQPAIFSYANFGAKWTCDWVAYINDNPQNALADVNYYMPGGGLRVFSGFNTNTQSFVFQALDHTLLTRTGPASYQMLFGDGSMFVFEQSDGATGTSRKVFLSRMIDPFGNALTLSYDANLRLISVTDAIGQVTTLSYANATDLYKVTSVTDPFGRSASFDYDGTGRLTNITDVIGLHSQFAYEGTGDFINTLITPYGTTTFARGGTNTIRWLETTYPDGSRDRVEFNQTSGLAIPGSEPQSNQPKGMNVYNAFLDARNTYYWSRVAAALGYGDYYKARVYHWLHTADGLSASGTLESMKEPLENRVWYSYAGQSQANYEGTNDLPQKVGRVLDDGTTQLYSYGYDGFGHLTNSVDPIGRTFSYLYSTNGIDLLEERMTRAGKNELLSKRTYNSQHLPLTVTDAAGQTTTYTYNSRGQILTKTNPKGETTTYGYDSNGYLLTVDGPLPGTNDTETATYDSMGRISTRTDSSGYTIKFEHDAMDRLTKLSYPDGTFEQYIYDRLDPVLFQDRAGRQTRFEYDSMGQLVSRTDPLGRTVHLQWCTCGDIKSVTDPMGRTTMWQRDVQNRLVSKQYGDGTRVTYTYEATRSRLRQLMDEKQQTTSYFYNMDDTLRAIGYGNCTVVTPPVNFQYDPDYARPTAMTDGSGTTVYQYIPINSPPRLGAGKLLSEDGPLGNDTITYSYDELGRRVSTAVNGVTQTLTFDQAGRTVGATNDLGAFAYAYDGSSSRILTETFPNGQTSVRSYGNAAQDFTLQRLEYLFSGARLYDSIYGRDVAADRISTWSRQAGQQNPDLYSFAYDAANQLVSATVTNAGQQTMAFSYRYDPLGNRLMERAGNVTNTAAYNPLNQLNTAQFNGVSRTNEWDAQNRLSAVSSGNSRTEFGYDGRDRLISIRQSTNGVQSSFRRFVWSADTLLETRDESGSVVTRYFSQGFSLKTGTNAGPYYYSLDHLGSVCQLTDGNGNVRAAYRYDPFGRRSRVSGDVDSDYGFAGLFHASEADLDFARYRAYDAALGRWLSRDPLDQAEIEEGPNLYLYAANDPVNASDRLGLCCEREKRVLEDLKKAVQDFCEEEQDNADRNCAFIASLPNSPWKFTCRDTQKDAGRACEKEVQHYAASIAIATANYNACLKKCHKPRCSKPKGPGRAPFDVFTSTKSIDTSSTY